MLKIWPHYDRSSFPSKHAWLSLELGLLTHMEDYGYDSNVNIFPVGLHLHSFEKIFFQLLYIYPLVSDIKIFCWLQFGNQGIFIWYEITSNIYLLCHGFDIWFLRSVTALWKLYRKAMIQLQLPLTLQQQVIVRNQFHFSSIEVYFVEVKMHIFRI